MRPSRIAKTSLRTLSALAVLALTALPTLASEASLALPSMELRHPISFNILGQWLSGHQILAVGIVICLLGLVFGAFQYRHLKALPAHKSMLDVSEMIYGTCRTYLMQQAKLLLALLVLIGIVMGFYFGKLSQPACSGGEVALILMWSLVGMAGSFAVAWFGIRINNIANSRMAFAALKGDPMPLHEIPTRSGMSIGVCLVSIELIMMITVLMFVPPALAGFCFVGFAIGESLGAAVLRVCGGIFTKIADVGSDMMKIVFKIKEDDARNPGVIADCAGDNAGDSVGPTADGFETYGVTGVALISFILLAVGQMMPDGHLLANPVNQWKLIVWIFTMRIAMVVISVLAWKLNGFLVPSMAGAKSGKKFNFEHPLTSLVWVTSLLCIAATFVLSRSMLQADFGDLWWRLSVIISCGTIAGAVIPELTRIFTSMHSGHCKEVVDATKEGGTGLTVLSGIVAGNFSAFWKGMTILGLMLIAFLASRGISHDLMIYPAVFAFGLVAFGMLGMGPVTIAVDSYGPVTDNAQSVFELSTIESIPNASGEIQKQFGFKPDFAKGKEYLEENDGCGNTFKATAKPMLIGTAVVGATTMIFSLVLLLKKELNWESLEKLSIVDPWVILGMLAGGAVIYWFCGASMQAVTTGAYRAVDYIKKHIKLDGATKASQGDSNEVVRICTKYAQAGMINIFVVVFAMALAIAFINPQMFCAYLISIALFGLFAAIYMANAGGCWDNAKKVVEVELKQKGTPLHDSTVVGDLVGDPFKDTSSVALNPIIKFTTLFGILAAEIAISPGFAPYKHKIAVVFLVVGLAFVLRSFYGMRISSGSK